MSIALELGTREFRSLRRDGHRLIGRSCPCVYVVLPEGTSERKLLEQARIGYSVCNGSLLVMGQPAIELARSLKLPCLTPFEANRLPPGDTIARQVVATMIEAAIPRRVPVQFRCALAVPGSFRARTGSSDEVRCLSGPNRELLVATPSVSTAATLAQFVRLQGYIPSVLSASYALGLAELGRNRMTGIALHFGAGECQASLLQQGRELLHVGIPRGEDSLLDEWARLRGKFVWDYQGHCYLHQLAVREWRDRTQPSLERPTDDDSQAWKEFVVRLVMELVSDFSAEMVRIPDLTRLKPGMPMVFAGELTESAGFGSLLHQTFAAQGELLPQLAIRPAADPHCSVSRGLLIFAESMADNAAEIARPLSRVG